MDKQKAVSDHLSVRSSVLTQRELAAHLYRQGVDGITRYMEILAEETDTQLAAAAQREAELRDVLGQIAQYSRHDKHCRVIPCDCGYRQVEETAARLLASPVAEKAGNDG